MDRFIVAPGELLLASNGNGGLTRVSGTSFSAPLVSGAITLLHDRWPWLTNHPAETTDIVLRSARDLGAPGVDAVYGRGMLDVEASQSPLNFNNLTYVRYKGSETTGTSISTTDARAGSVPLTFETDGMFYYAIETIGNTRRDFAIPLSTRLIGTKTSVSGTSEYFQSYVAARMNDWIKANRPATATTTFSDVETAVDRISADWTFGLTMSAPQYAQGSAMRLVNLPKPVATLAHPEGRYGFSVGLGEGVRTLGGQRGFGLSSDYDPANGGVNPMLGYATGGAFASVDLALNAKTTLSLGFSEGTTPVAETFTLTDADRRRFSGLRAYKAGAGTVRLKHRPSSNVSLTVDYARINESNGIFGVRSLEDSDFAKGATTETATFGADIRLPGNMSIAGSATLGLTRAKKRVDQAFALADSGALSSAFAISVDKQGILGKRDKLRLSASQPLTIESGAFDFTSVGITDRTTGELGEITQRFGIKSRTRRFAGEAIYATPLADAGELSLFGRVDLGQKENGKVDGILIGGRLNLRF